MSNTCPSPFNPSPVFHLLIAAVLLDNRRDWPKEICDVLLFEEAHCCLEGLVSRHSRAEGIVVPDERRCFGCRRGELVVRLLRRFHEHLRQVQREFDRFWRVGDGLVWLCGKKTSKSKMVKVGKKVSEGKRRCQRVRGVGFQPGGEIKSKRLNE